MHRAAAEFNAQSLRGYVVVPRNPDPRELLGVRELLIRRNVLASVPLLHHTELNRLPLRFDREVRIVRKPAVVPRPLTQGAVCWACGLCVLRRRLPAEG